MTNLTLLAAARVRDHRKQIRSDVTVMRCLRDGLLPRSLYLKDVPCPSPPCKLLNQFSWEAAAAV